MTAQEQLEAVRNQLLDAYMARDDAEQRIKALRNMLAGIQIGRTLAGEPEATQQAEPVGE